MELHFWFWPVRVKDQRPRWGSLSSGIIRRDRLLVGWAPDGPVSAARLLSMVAVHPWLLFTYYRSAVVREIREEAASRQMALIASRAEAAFSCRRSDCRSMAALRTRRRAVVMYVRLQQPNVVPSSSRPWSNFRTVANIPPRHGRHTPAFAYKNTRGRALSKRPRRVGVPRFLMGAASAAVASRQQAGSKLPDEPAIPKRRSRQRRCFIRGARVAALALSSIISLFQTGQPKNHPGRSCGRHALRCSSS